MAGTSGSSLVEAGGLVTMLREISSADEIEVKSYSMHTSGQTLVTGSALLDGEKVKFEIVAGSHRDEHVVFSPLEVILE